MTSVWFPVDLVLVVPSPGADCSLEKLFDAIVICVRDPSGNRFSVVRSAPLVGVPVISKKSYEPRIPSWRNCIMCSLGSLTSFRVVDLSGLSKAVIDTFCTGKSLFQGAYLSSSCAKAASSLDGWNSSSGAFVARKSGIFQRYIADRAAVRMVGFMQLFFLSGPGICRMLV